MAVPGERPAANRGATAQAGAGLASPFGGDEILGWLDVLLKGKPEQQAHARTEIAMILEARGFTEDAEEAYWTNVQARSTDRRSYERLIALYQLRKDRLSESLIRRQLDEVFAEPEPARPVRSPRSAAPRESENGSVSLARRFTSPGPAAPDMAPAPPIRRLRSARRTEEPASPPPDSRRSAPDDDVPAPTYGRFPRPAQPPVARGLAIVPARPQAVQPTAVMPEVSVVGPANGRRRAQLNPNPRRSYGRYRIGGGLIALQPATIFAFLLASFGAAALIAFVLISSDRGSTTRLTSSGMGQASTRCVDGSVRFPGASDPRGAVASAYRQQGVDVESSRAGNPRLTVDQAEQVIGGWIGASLLLEHAGQAAPKLNEWLDAESTRPSLANAILAGRHLDTMLTADEWAEIQSWPASTCEGGFVHDPRNAGLVRLMERVVAR